MNRNLLSFLIGATLLCLTGALPAPAQTFYAADANGNMIQYWGDGTEASVRYLSTVSEDGTKAGHIVIPATVHYDEGNVDFSVTSVESNAFYDRDDVLSVKFGANVQRIGQWAFYGCDNLAQVDFVDATELSTISDRAFGYCRTLATVQLPASLTTLGYYSFLGCEALESISIPDGVATVPGHCFSGCSALRSVRLGAAVTTVGNNAFYNCKALETFTANQALQTIESNALSYCTALQLLNLSTTELSSVGNYALRGCTELREVRFPEALTSLGNSCFYECSALSKVVLPGATVPFTTSTSLPTTCLLWVPADMVEAYTANSYSQQYRTIVIGSQTDFVVTTTDGSQLQAKVEAQGAAANCISLKVTGPINGTDINYLHQRLTALEELDLADAQIVSGGDSYNTFNIGNDGTVTAASESYNTEDNIVGRAMFWNMPHLRRIVLPTTVTALGRSAFGKCTALEECVIPEGVTEIGAYCFANSTSLGSNANKIRQMTLPSTLRTIGDYAFAYMNKWESVSIPEGVTKVPQYAFYYCQALKSVNIPATVTEIGYRAFNQCVRLENLALPAGLTTMGDLAFSDCTALSGTLTVPGTLTTIPSSAFIRCSALESVVLSEGIEKIKEYAFYNDNLIRTVSFPSTLTAIGHDAFSNCKSLEAVNLPASLTSLEYEAFSECDSLRTFTFPDAITSVPSSVLAYCDNLESVTLAPQTTTIGSSAFHSCPKLASVNFNLATLTKIENYTFYGTGFTSITLPEQIVVGNSCFAYCRQLQSVNVPSANASVPDSYVSNCTALTSVTLPATITKIESSAFYNCSALPAIELPAGVTSIGNSAFRACTALQLDALPTGLATIGNSAFEGCKGITQLTIPSSVTNVSSNAFWETGLRSVSFECQNPTLGTYVFRGCDSLTSVVLPPAMTELPYGTFYYCTALPAITLPATLRSLNGYTFYNCNKLAAIEFPAGLNTIEEGDFQYTAIAEVVIPDSVTKVGSYAFANCQKLRRASLGRNQDYSKNSSFDYFMGCDSLQTLRIFAGMPPAISSYYAPRNHANITLEVPAGTADLYAAADVWKEFGTINTFLTGDKLAAADFTIMKRFYTQMNGDGWEKPWDLQTDDRYIGKWQGVTTDGDHIVSIDLTAQGLSGDLKADIFALPCLTSLNLSDNAITGHLESVFSAEADADTVLTDLNLCGNLLEGDIAPFAAKLPRLTKLNVSYNCLTEVSALIDRTYLNSENDYLDKRYQFVQHYTKTPVIPASYQLPQIRLGEPFSWEFNTLQTYRQSSQDWGRSSSNIYGSRSEKSYWYDQYYLTYYDYWFRKNSDDLYVADENCYMFKGTRDVTILDFGTSGYATQPFQIDWTDGDVNIDLTVDVTDLQGVIYYALNDSRPSSIPYNYTTADGNGDGKLDVLDCIINVNRILSYEQQGPEASRALYRIMYDARNVVNIEDGDLKLMGSDEVAAVQLTLRGCRADDVACAPRNFTIAARDMADGGVRVLIYSMDGTTLPAGQTTLLRDLPASAILDDVRLSDAEGLRLGAAISGEATGVTDSSLVTGNSLQIYDLQGRRVNELATGQMPRVYIVKTKDGQFKIRR